jgi:pimeloyl-ACP methyl ester carboxylesterase
MPRYEGERMSTHEVKDAVLHYQQTGSGPDIVWLAAGDHPGANWRRWQVPSFEPGWRNTTYDARGVGQTTSSTDSPWPISIHAEDVIQLIEAVCEPPVALVGLSMGSLIGVQVAHDRPDLVSCVAAMGTCVKKTGFIWEWEEAEIELRRSGATLPREFATAHYALLYYPAEVLGDDELWAELRSFIASDFSERDGAMLAAQWQACLEYDSTELLPKIDVPIHAVAFSEDVQTPPQRVRQVSDLAANGHFHLLQGLGHGSAFGHRPDVVNACLREIIGGYLPPA